MKYRVLRHGGREGDWWRILYEGPDPEEARRVFEKAREEMRQGGLLLRDPRGEVIDKAWAPRLRTRW